MYIKQDMDFNDLINNCWSGALDTLKTIEEHDKEDELMQLLEDAFEECPDITRINDYLWFSDEDIFECLGISETEEEEEESEIDFSFYKDFNSFCEDHRCKDCPLWHPIRDCKKEFEQLRNT